MKNRYAFEGILWNPEALEFWNSGIPGSWDSGSEEMWNFEGMRVWCGVTNAFWLHLIN